MKDNDNENVNRPYKKSRFADQLPHEPLTCPCGIVRTSYKSFMNHVRTCKPGREKEEKIAKNLRLLKEFWEDYS